MKSAHILIALHHFFHNVLLVESIFVEGISTKLMVFIEKQFSRRTFDPRCQKSRITKIANLGYLFEFLIQYLIKFLCSDFP